MDVLTNRCEVTDPVVLSPDPEKLNNWANESPRPFVDKKLDGVYWRVYPETERDVSFLIHLQHWVQKWASAEPDGGIIIPRNMLP